MSDHSLRFLLPKGRLFEKIAYRLADIQMSLDAAGRDYRLISDCDWLSATGRLVKPRVIPQLLHYGLFDVGFTGLDIVREADYEEVLPLFDLGLNRVSMVVAVAKEQEHLLTDPPKRPLRIATEYPSIADRWATGRNLAHICIQTYGSTEGYAPDIADLVLDCVETGETMRANRLTILETLFDSTTHLVASRAALAGNKREMIERLKRKLEETK